MLYVEDLTEYSIRSFSIQPVTKYSCIMVATYLNHCYRLLDQLIANNYNMREIRQFHFTALPDHGVSKYGTPLVSFQKKIDEFHDPNKHGPMVVHGSAGVGRTGTFITLDAQLQKIKYEGTLDIFNFVRYLCYYRNYMIQTQVV